jgi:hypothetical protein
MNDIDKNLRKLPVTLKIGNEPLSNTGKTLLDFWRWNGSDLASNATRGVLAEFIVATALKVNLSIPRDEWSAWDLTTQEGIRIEVKSAAYLQSWTQKDFSRIVFSIRQARSWDGDSSSITNKPQRPADVYIFCLLKHQKKETLNPLDLGQWEFYVVSTAELNNYPRSSTSITLASVQKLTYGIPYEELRGAVLEIVNKNK